VGLGVILDVVYNHLGPDGNYLKEFSESYFTDRYPNDWGEAINFDGEGSGPVREFVLANAAYWSGARRRSGCLPRRSSSSSRTTTRSPTPLAVTGGIC